MYIYIRMGLWNIHDKRKHDTSKVVHSRTLLQWTVCCLFWHLCISQSLKVIIDCKHTLVHMKWETKPDSNQIVVFHMQNDDGWRSLVLTQSTHHFTSLLLYDCKMKWTQWNTHDFMAPLLLISRRKKFIFVNRGSQQQKENKL